MNTARIHFCPVVSLCTALALTDVASGFSIFESSAEVLSTAVPKGGKNSDECYLISNNSIKNLKSCPTHPNQIRYQLISWNDFWTPHIKQRLSEKRAHVPYLLLTKSDINYWFHRLTVWHLINTDQTSFLFRCLSKCCWHLTNKKTDIASGFSIFELSANVLSTLVLKEGRIITFDI